MYRRTESKEKLPHSYDINLCKFWKRKLYTFGDYYENLYLTQHSLPRVTCTIMLILVLPEKREKEKRKNLLCTNICKDVIDVDSFNTH